MAEAAREDAGVRREPEDQPKGGIVGFARWFARNRFHHMEDYLDELEQDPATIDAGEVRARFLRATVHGQRVLAARLVVTVLLALGVITTATASIANAIDVPEAFQGDVEVARDLFARIAGYAGSATVLLLALRLGFDRYLRLIETTAMLLAMQLSAARRVSAA